MKNFDEKIGLEREFFIPKRFVQKLDRDWTRNLASKTTRVQTTQSSHIGRISSALKFCTTVA